MRQSKFLNLQIGKCR